MARSPMGGLAMLPSSEPAATVVGTLLRDGCVVVRDHVTKEDTEAMRREQSRFLERPDAEIRANKTFECFGTDEFLPGNTRRVTGLILKSPAFRNLVTSPLMLAVADAILK